MDPKKKSLVLLGSLTFVSVNSPVPVVHLSISRAVKSFAARMRLGLRSACRALKILPNLFRQMVLVAVERWVACLSNGVSVLLESTVERDIAVGMLALHI